MNDEYIDILTGDFIKNAGIVGMVTLLELNDAKDGTDYIIKNNQLSIKKSYFKSLDLTDLYFKSMVKRYKDDTIVPKIIQTINYVIQMISNEDNSSFEKNIKESLTFISEKLSAASYKTGIESIKNELNNVEIYYDVIDKSFKKSAIDDRLKELLIQLKSFLEIDIVFETLCFKSITYNIINKFWERSFLLRNNAKKNMRECFQNDFVDPLMNYFEEETSKMKDQCVDCGLSINNKYSVSVSFMKDFADDLSRKRSSLYNFEAGMNLCPICAFLYALSPLGFLKYNRDFIFVNQNGNINDLCRVNGYNMEHSRKEIEKDYVIKDKYQKIYQIIETYALEKQSISQYNIQVITRSVKDDGSVKYEFDILDKYLIDLFQNNEIKKTLNYFKTKNAVKINGTFISVFREMVHRLLNRLNLYDLIHILLRLVISDDNLGYITYYASRLITVQYIINGGKNMKELYFARRDGFNLRQALGNVDEAYRGTIYQLINALKVDDRLKFMDTVIRIYSSMSIPIPTSIPGVLENENGLEIAYAFVAGLKGAYAIKNKEEQEDE